jgi:hypothetical protein
MPGMGHINSLPGRFGRDMLGRGEPFSYTAVLGSIFDVVLLGRTGMMDVYLDRADRQTMLVPEVSGRASRIVLLTHRESLP